MKICFSLYLLLLGVALGGCAGPRYSLPLQQASPDILEEAELKALDSSIFEEGEWINLNWWEKGGDPQLNAYMTQALYCHPSLKKAEARIARAQNIAWQTDASTLYPRIYLHGDAKRMTLSKTGLFGNIREFGRNFNYSFTQTEIYVDLYYEFDIWSKNRYAVEALMGEMYATIADYAVARHLLSLAVAEAYIKTQLNLRREEIACHIAEKREELAVLTAEKVKKGLESQSILHLTERDLLNAENFLLSLEQEEGVAKHKLQALIAADCPEEVDMEPSEVLDFGCFPISCELPIDLLSHRPDIMAKRWRVQEAALQVSVAQAACYPNIDLSGLWGLQTISLGKLLDARSYYQNWGPALHLPIFDAGALKAEVGVREAEFHEAAEDYNEAVLDAVQEVLDGLVKVEKTYEEWENAQDIVDQLESIYAIESQRFANQLTSRLDLINAEISYLDGLDHQTVAKSSHLLAVIELIRAIGGGYTFE